MRVASVPASHVYVRHLSDPDGFDDVVRLDDPVPVDGRKVPGGWWPPLMLEPGWVDEHHELFDVFHLHFGFDAIGADALCEVMGELKRHDKPFVYTVHDLRNPHHLDPQAHNEQQDVLVGSADQLVTLTPGAAQAIQDRWGRSARVLPHPHVLEPARINRQRTVGDRFVVGLHAKSVRANMDPLPVVDVLVEIIAALPSAELQINVHDEIFQPGNHWFAPEAAKALLTYQRHDHVRVVVHPYFSDDELWEYLSSLTVSVLPYRFGSHSGWLEACFDLGTAVIAPSCGFYAEQRPCGVFEFTENGFDEDSLRDAVETAYASWCSGCDAPRATWTDRRGERRDIALAHRALYEDIRA